LIHEGEKNLSVYSFKAKLSNGEEISLDTYKGKVMLIVNTASKCGFTPQYEGLEKLFETYKENGFTVLGFHVTNLEDKSQEVMRRLAAFAH
jgi:glutathione peroxidase